MDDENLEIVEIPDTGLLEMTAMIVSSYVSNNAVSTDQIPAVITEVHTALATLGTPTEEPAAEPLKPAVPVKKSITPDYLVCLEDGKKLKMLKRHLRTAYDMSPEDYRAKWGLPADYPMVAPNYAKQRSEFAKKIGLGKAAEGGRRGRRSKAS